MPQKQFDKGWVHIKRHLSIANQKIELFKKGEITSILTASDKINEFVNLLPGDQLVVGGRTGVGKSIFANWLIKGFFDSNPDKKIVVGYFSIEMLPWRQVLRWYSSMTRQTIKEILHKEERYDPEAVQRYYELSKQLSDYEIYFWDGLVTVSEYRDAALRLQDAHPDAQLITVFDHTRLAKAANYKKEEEKITALMETGIAIKHDLECLNIFLSQLNRNVEKTAANPKQMGEREPLLSDLFGADSVAQCADHVMILHRPELYRVETYLKWSTQNLIANHVVKQRDGWTGMIALTHDLRYNTLYDRDKNEMIPTANKKLTLPTGSSAATKFDSLF